MMRMLCRDVESPMAVLARRNCASVREFRDKRSHQRSVEGLLGPSAAPTLVKEAPQPSVCLGDQPGPLLSSFLAGSEGRDGLWHPHLAPPPALAPAPPHSPPPPLAASARCSSAGAPPHPRGAPPIVGDALSSCALSSCVLSMLQRAAGRSKRLRTQNAGGLTAVLVGSAAGSSCELFERHKWWSWWATPAAERQRSCRKCCMMWLTGRARARVARA